MMSDENAIILGDVPLSLKEFAAVARNSRVVEVSPTCRERVDRAREHVEHAVAEARKAENSGKPIPPLYGVTTGFGEHKKYLVRPEDAHRLQANILRSHAIGVGERLSHEIIRGVGLLRLSTFLHGRSGVRWELIERIRDLLNTQLIPIVPEKGSLGASGDLCPLAHWALVLIGEGLAAMGGEDLPGTIALKRADLDTHFTLSYKEGLALTNGTAVSTAIAALAVLDAINLLRHADLAAAASAEVVGAPTRAYHENVHGVRPHPGQLASAENLRHLLAGSEWVNTSDEVQESYSIRCTPQVNGASAEAIAYAKRVVEREMNSVTDNPLFFVEENDPPPPDGGKVSQFLDYSAGNFHGQPIALAMDFLGLAVAELANIAERRVQKLLDKHHNAGLPASLSTQPGLQSGLMIAQYTAASLVSENKTLCHPASCDSIPTSANIEDHVSMSMTAGRHAQKIIENVEAVTAIELLCSYQAQCFRRAVLPSPEREFADHQLLPNPERSFGPASESIFAVMQDQGIEPVASDRPLAEEVQKIRQMINEGIFLGELRKKTEYQLFGKFFE